MDRQKKTTINDIAREAGVSRSLVSSVLTNLQEGRKVYRVSDKTTARIQAIIDSHDYRPNNFARVLRSGDNRTIGVILSDISNRFFAVASRSIGDYAHQHGYMVMFGNTDESPEKLSETMDLFYSKGVQGFIVVPCEGCEGILSAYREKGVPMVFLDRDFEDSGISSVTLNNKEASVQLTRQLLLDGHRKVEFVSYDTTLHTILDREGGYRQEMESQGCGIHIRVHRPEYGNFDEVEKIMLDAVSRGVEAMVFATYRMALLGRHAILRHSITSPCAFACFNNADTFDMYEQGMYYVKQPIDMFAKKSIELLVAQLEKRSDCPCTKLVLPPKIEQTRW